MRLYPVAGQMLFGCLIVLLPLPSKEAPQGTWMNDREITQELRAEGMRYDRDNATLYFEKNALPTEQMDTFADLVNQGIKDIEALLKLPLERKRAQSGNIFYFVSSKIDIGRSRGRSVFLPAWRVQSKAAPYLHETTHILAKCSECPMWFSEGYASWMQSYISENIGGYDAAVFAKHGNRGVDADAAHWLASPNGRAVLPFVLEGGEPPDIVAERHAVGAPFYVLAQSLVKHVVSLAGIDKVNGLAHCQDFNAELATATGKAPEDLKKDWLATLRREAH